MIKSMLMTSQQIFPRQNRVILFAMFMILIFATSLFAAIIAMSSVAVLALFAMCMSLFILLLFPERRRLVLGLLIFVIPLNVDINFFEKPSPGGADGLSFGLVEIFLALLLIFTIVRSVSSKQTGSLRFFPALLLPSLAILVFYFISMMNAADLVWSLFDIFNFVKVILFYLVLANNIHNETDVSVVLVALFLGVLVQTAITTTININPEITDLFLRLKIGVAGDVKNMTAVNGYFRSGGSLGNANHLGRYFGLLLPLAFMMLLTRWNRILTAVAGLAALFGVFAIFNTLSRSAWIGLVLSLIIILPFMLSHRLVSFRTLGLLGVVAIFGAFFLFIFGDAIWARLTQDDHGSAKTRITTAKVAWAIIKDYPFFGCGINNFGCMLPDYWIGEDAFTNKAAVHNNYLLYMAEIGIVGFTSIVWWLVAFGARVRRAMFSKNRLYSAIAIGILGGYAAMLLESLTDKCYKENFSLLLIIWALMALTEAIIRLDGENRHDHQPVAF